MRGRLLAETDRPSLMDELPRLAFNPLCPFSHPFLSRRPFSLRMEAPVARLPLALHVEHSALPLVAIRVCLFSFYAFVITFLVDSKLVDPWRLSHTGTAMTAILSMGKYILLPCICPAVEESGEGPIGGDGRARADRIRSCPRLGGSRRAHGLVQERVIHFKMEGGSPRMGVGHRKIEEPRPNRESVGHDSRKGPSKEARADLTSLHPCLGHPAVALASHQRLHRRAHKGEDRRHPRSRRRIPCRTPVSRSVHPFSRELAHPRSRAHPVVRRSSVADTICAGNEESLNRTWMVFSHENESNLICPGVVCEPTSRAMTLTPLYPRPLADTDIQSLRRTPSSVRFAPHPIVTQIPSHDSSSSSMEMLPLPTPTVSPPNGRDQDPTTPNDRTDEKTKQEAMLNVPPTSDSARPASPIEFSSPFAPSRPSMPEKTPSGNAARRLSSALAPPAPSNLPLSILRLIHAHLDGLVAVGAMKDATRDRCLSAIEGLSDDLGKAEKIRDSQYLKSIRAIPIFSLLTRVSSLSTSLVPAPIPLPLSIHLHQMLSLFLLSIPPQLASTLGSWTIPVTGIATFCFLGVDSIGEKLADPFGVHGQSS